MPGPRAGDITPDQRQRLHRYLDEIERWRRRLNLSTVPRSEAWQRHVEESRRLLRAAAPARGESVVDIGSGAGIPGVVMAVLRPDLAVTLLEASSRKAGFLVHVCGLLELGGVRVDARRAEAAADDPATRGSFGLAVSRAAAPPDRLCRLALPLLRPGGELWALVGEGAAAAAGSAEVVAPGLMRVRKPPAVSG